MLRFSAKLFVDLVIFPEIAYHCSMQSLFSFPNPVNERSARLVAGGVVVMCIGVVAFNQMWILIPLAYGFVARVATGPTLSPLGQFVTRVAIPATKWKPKYVPGPPKRFAQGIGAVLSSAAFFAWLVCDTSTPARIITGVILVAATLESVVGFCLGCTIFSWLMKSGIVPESVCEACVIPTR